MWFIFFLTRSSTHFWPFWTAAIFTQLQFLLSQNCSQQTCGPWHVVTLCYMQEAGLVLLIVHAQCALMNWKSCCVVLCCFQGAVFLLLHWIRTFRCISSSEFSVPACLPLHGPEWKCLLPAIWLLKDTWIIFKKLIIIFFKHLYCSQGYCFKLSYRLCWTEPTDNHS